MPELTGIVGQARPELLVAVAVVGSVDAEYTGAAVFHTPAEG